MGRGRGQLTAAARRWECAVLGGDAAAFIQYPSSDKVPTKCKVKADQSAYADEDQHAEEGHLASVACSLLMKVLWAARLARPDLLRAVIHLATKITKWTST